MTQHPDAKVFIVDDDAGVRDALAWLLRTRRLLSERYDSADAFLAEITRWSSEPSVPCCLLLDVRMPGTSGLALFEQLLALPWQAAMPVIFLSGHADVPTAVDAVKRGAFDFCEKPFSDNALVDRVEQALALSAQVQEGRRAQRSVQQRLDSLTGDIPSGPEAAADDQGDMPAHQPAHFADACEGIAALGHLLAEMGGEEFPRLRGAHAARQALEQGNAELALEFRDLAAHHRGVDAQKIGRRAHRAAAHGLDQVSQVMIVQPVRHFPLRARLDRLLLPSQR